MKIAFFTPIYQLPDSPARGSGGVISNRVLMERLAQEHELLVHAAYSDVVGYHRIGPPAGGYELSGMLLATTHSRFKRFLAAKAWRTEAIRRALEFKPDIVLAATSGLHTALELRRMTGVPVIAIVRAVEHLRQSEGGNWNARRELQWGRSDTSALDECDAIVFCSEFLRDVYKPHVPRPELVVVYPPLDLSLSTNRWDGSTERVLLIGDSHRKGWDVLEDLASHDTARIYMHTGRSPVSAANREASGLQALGWVGDREELFGRCDVIVAPSRQEPFGRVAVEALSQGKAVLVSNTGGLPEAVSREPALIVDGWEWSEWLKGLNWLREHPDEARAAVARARNEVEKFEAERQYSTLVSLIQRVSEDDTPTPPLR